MVRTAKYQDLLDDPIIKYKPVESLPGIEVVYGRRLRDSGFQYADQLLAKYIELRRNEHLFTNWLNSVCSANSRSAAMCFNSLHEWYSMWRHDLPSPVSSPKLKNTITYEKLPFYNQMLANRKMSQSNLETNNDGSSNLTQARTRSLVDVSTFPKRIPISMERLNISHINIPEQSLKPLKVCKANTADYSKSFDGIFKPSSPTQKSVNFKENDEIIMPIPRKTTLYSSKLTKQNISHFSLGDIPYSGKLEKENKLQQPISPILKSRSLTPENLRPTGMRSKSSTKASAKRPSNINLQVPLHVTPRNNVEMEKINRSRNVKNQLTTTKHGAQNFNAKNNTRRIKKSVKSQKDFYENENNLDSNIFDSTWENQNELNSFEKIMIWRITPQDIGKYFDDEHSASEVMKSSLESHATSIPEEHHSISQTIELGSTTNSSYSPISHAELSNEDSGFDRTIEYSIASQTPENCDTIDAPRAKSLNDSYSIDDHRSNDGVTSPSFHYVQNDKAKTAEGYLTRSESSDDECLKSFEHDSSLPANESEHTYNVNEPSDVESGLDMVAASTATESVTINLENNDIDYPDETASFEGSDTEKSKKTSIRLFCDMLSNDLKQVPEDKIRKLKLRILELVYSEIDEHKINQSD